MFHTLEPLLIDPPELKQRIEATNQKTTHNSKQKHHVANQSGSAAKYSRVLDTNDDPVANVALRMAVLSTFCRLLEQALVVMEDDVEGTGTLEADLKLL